MPAYKSNVRRFPRIFALLSGNHTRMWSYFLFSASLVHKCLCFRNRHFQYFDMTRHDMEPFRKFYMNVIGPDFIEYTAWKALKALNGKFVSLKSKWLNHHSPSKQRGPPTSLNLVAMFSEHVGKRIWWTSKSLCRSEFKEKKELGRTSVRFLIGRPLMEALFFPNLK